jgi:hypothetical protein
MTRKDPTLDLFYFGWLGASLERSADAPVQTTWTSTALELDQDHPALAQPIWDYMRAQFGRDASTQKQTYSDSPARALATAFERVMAIRKNQFVTVMASWWYVTGRHLVAPVRVLRDGTTVAWCLDALSKYGYLDATNPRAPQTILKQSISHTNKVRPVLATLQQDAKHVDVQFYRLPNDVECIRVFVSQYRVPVIIASYQGFQWPPTVYNDRVVWVPHGVWPHVMTFIEYDHEFDALYRLNSWGDCGLPTPNGETPGGAWNALADVHKELHDGPAFCYACVV